MGLFNRRKIADFFGVSPARISQMSADGDIIPAIDDEDRYDRGWPETYVEEVAARRQGRQTSRSIYGIPAPATPYTPVADTIVNAKFAGHAFIQLVDVDGDRVGLITSLNEIHRQPRPMRDQLGPRPSNLILWDGDDLLPLIHQAATDFTISYFDVVWIYLDTLHPTEVVIVSEPRTRTEPHRRGRLTHHTHLEETTRIDRITWPTLAAKLGAPVPILGAATVDAVEQWRQAGRKPIDIDFDRDGYYNRTQAASLLTDLTSKNEFGEQSELVDALRLAASRLTLTIPWSESGQAAPSYVAEANPDTVTELTTTRQPDFRHYRDRIADTLISDPDRTRDERQAAANLLGRLLYNTYGEYGDQPSPAVSFALNEGIRAIVVETTAEMDGDAFSDSVTIPRFHSLRTAPLPTHRPTLAHEYVTTLTGPRRAGPPEYGVLDERSRQHASYETVRDANIYTDVDGNYALVRTLTDYGHEDEPYDEVTIAVPTASLATRDLHHLKHFTEIIVDPDTQNGPVWLRLADGSLHVMPFATATTEGFTHGYGGTGPSNLAHAIRGFLEWVAGGPITPAGNDHLRTRIMGSEQGRQLTIARDQVMQPGAFTPPHP